MLAAHSVDRALRLPLPVIPPISNRSIPDSLISDLFSNATLGPEIRILIVASNAPVHAPPFVGTCHRRGRCFPFAPVRQFIHLNGVIFTLIKKSITGANRGHIIEEAQNIARNLYFVQCIDGNQ